MQRCDKHRVRSAQDPLHSLHPYSRHIYILVSCHILGVKPKSCSLRLTPRCVYHCVRWSLSLSIIAQHSPCLIGYIFCILYVKYPVVLYRNLDLKQYANTAMGTLHLLLFLVCLFHFPESPLPVNLSNSAAFLFGTIPKSHRVKMHYEHQNISVYNIAAVSIKSDKLFKHLSPPPCRENF